VNQRRALVNAMSSVMGLYCRSLYALDVLGPLLKSGGFDQVRVVSHDGVFRLWAGMAWRLRLPCIGIRESGDNTRSVSGFNATDDFDGRILSEYSGLSGVKLVKCSDQHPDFEDLSLKSDSIGPRHAIRIVQGSRTTHESTGQEPLQSLRIDIPTEHCELDLLIHRSWLNADRTLSASIHSPGLGADLGTDDSWQQRLPIELASNVENPDAPHGAPVGWSLQQYSGLIAKAIEGSGHKRSDYVLRRVTLAYPPLPVDIVHGFAPPND
jgi:hypothetical protein